MSDKTPKPKQKITDITPPKKAANAASPQIVIEKRAHLERHVGPGADSADAPVSPSTTAPTPTPAAAPATPKRTVIAPPEGTEVKPAAPETAEVPKAEAATPPSPAAPTSSANSPAAEPATAATENEDSTADGNATDQAIDETKADKEAEAAARRNQELEKLIDTKQFFIPINKQAHKRSIKVTLWLTALYIFLSLVLVNLMLDTGMILLLQKLPHTNFFSV